MAEVGIPCVTEVREVLAILVERKVPAIMSYLSGGKWHAIKMLLTGLGANRLISEVLPGPKPQPLNIQIGQQVGISLKHGYGKLIFESAVIGLEASSPPTNRGVVVLHVPERIETVRRRSYFRVKVPEFLQVNVQLWHRRNGNEEARMSSDHCWQGRLVDISAGGAQLAFDIAQRLNFKERQFVRLKFAPVPYEAPLIFNAQIRGISPTADGKNVCLGLQMVGLEASRQGREALHRLVKIVEQYYQLNRSGVRTGAL